jgi:quinol monooxygenase YgiN
LAALLVLAAIVTTAQFGLAQDDENPIVALVRKSLNDPAKPFVLLVHIQAKTEQGPAVEAAFTSAIKASRKETGCLAYDLDRSMTDPTAYVVHEKWKSLADLQAHLATPHFRALREALASATEGSPRAEVFLPVAE